MKKFRVLLTLLIVMVLAFSTSTIAFAGGGDDEETPPTEVPIVIEQEEQEPAPPLTPEGNLTLVDDVEVTDEIDKQFITAVSKNGNYFYIVVDRSGDENNVHLLNLVDEADLMALMEASGVAPTTPTPEPTVEPTVEDEPEVVPEEQPPVNILPIILVVLILIGGGAFYYIKFIKNKDSNKGTNNLSEFDDDEDYDDDEPEYSIDDAFGDDEQIADDDTENKTY